MTAATTSANPTTTTFVDPTETTLSVRDVFAARINSAEKRRKFAKTENDDLIVQNDYFTFQFIEKLQDESKMGSALALRCLLTNNIKLNPKIICESIRFNRHELVQIIVDSDSVEIECWFLSFAIRHEAIDCLRLLIPKFVYCSGGNVTGSQLSLAVRSGNEECLKLLLDHCLSDFRIMASPGIEAVHLGKVSMVKLFPLSTIFRASRNNLFFDRLCCISDEYRLSFFSSLLLSSSSLFSDLAKKSSSSFLAKSSSSSTLVNPTSSAETSSFFFSGDQMTKGINLTFKEALFLESLYINGIRKDERRHENVIDNDAFLVYKKNFLNTIENTTNTTTTTTITTTSKDDSNNTTNVCCEMIRVVFSMKNSSNRTTQNNNDFSPTIYEEGKVLSKVLDLAEEEEDVWTSRDVMSAARFFIISGRSCCLMILFQCCNMDNLLMMFKCDSRFVDLAILHQQLECLKFLIKSGFTFTTSSINSCVTNKQPAYLHVLLTSLHFSMHENNFFLSSELIETAIDNYDVACMRILIKHGAPISKKAFFSARSISSILWVPLDLLNSAVEIRRQFLELKSSNNILA